MSARMCGGAAAAVAVASGGVAVLWLRFNAVPPARGTLYPHDVLYSYLPKLELVGRRLAAGELPLWNPDGCAGVPVLAALQPAVLYPGTWLAAWLPADVALSALLAVHLVVGGAGAAVLFRGWGVPPAVAGAFGAVFAFAALLGQAFWPPQVATMVWLPWILHAIDRVVARDGPGVAWVALALCTALQLFAGFPQYVLYGAQLSVPYAALRAARRPERRVRALVRVALAMALGAGIAAAQLLPALELVARSDRGGPLSEREMHYLKSEARLDAWLENAVTPDARLTSYEVVDGAGYLGTATLVLIAVASTRWRREPLVWLLAGLGLLSLLLADGYLGAARGLFGLYAALPVVGSLRAPERLLFAAWFCAIALAALGARACDRALAAGAAPRAPAVAAAGLAALGVALLGTGAAWRAALAAAFVAAAHVAPRRPAVRRAWSAGLALFVLVDVALATGPYGSFRALPRAWAETVHVGGHPIAATGDVVSLQRRAGLGRIEFVGDRVIVRPIAGIGPLDGLHRLACYETPALARWAAVARAVRSGDYESTTATNVDPARFPTLLDVASVVHVTRVAAPPKVARRLNAPGERYARDAVPREPPPRSVSVAGEWNDDALPRAYLVDRYEVASEAGARTAVLLGTFDPHAVVLLDREPHLAEPGRIPRAVPAEIEHYAPERVEIAVDAPVEALLVLTDTHDPGWRASVDGAPAEILLANALFRAVRVPAGAHRVVFAYEPAGFRIGAWVSLASLVAALGVPLAMRARRADAGPR